jgi:hypothetical protein
MEMTVNYDSAAPQELKILMTDLAGVEMLIW